ncbi:hypothetical protein [Streptomyces sp. NBC_00356]|uniref:hypothetical protein n=1 Tax=Streptomyces sp. NBC_00356 TaxID=2975724 RepID=UPI002E258919
MLEEHVPMQGYLDVLRTPGLRVPLLAMVLGALPIGMLGLGLLLYVHRLTGSLADGGLAAAAFGLGNAAGMTAQGRLIDSYGQAKVLAPVGAACAAWSLLLVAAVPAVGGRGIAVAASAGLGSCIPATTGSMRVLLAELLRGAEVRTAGYAMLAVLFQLALLNGPLATSLLLVSAGPGASVVTGGFLAGGAGALFSMTRASRSWKPARKFVRHDGVRKNAGLAVLLLITAGTGLSSGMVAVAVPAAALSLGNAADSGVLIAMMSAGEITAGLVFGAIPWRRSAARLLLAAVAGSAVAVGLAACAAGSLALLFPSPVLGGSVRRAVRHRFLCAAGYAGFPGRADQVVHGDGRRISGGWRVGQCGRRVHHGGPRAPTGIHAQRMLDRRPLGRGNPVSTRP